MALDDRRMYAVDLLATGNYTTTEIGEMVGVSRQSIWAWKKEPEFKAELDSRLTALTTEANERLKAKLMPVMEELLKMALSDKTEARTKAQCLQYLATARAQKAVELFGARAGVALSNAFDDNKSLEDFVLTTEECTGAVTDAGDAFDNNFNTQLELAKKQFSGLAMEIGEKLMPTINNILSWVTDNMPAITSAIEGAISFISGILSPFIDIIKSIIASFQGADGETNSAFSSIKNSISSVITAVQGVIKSFVSLISAIWDKWGDDIMSVVTTVFNALQPIIQTALTLIKNVIDTITALINGDWQGFFDGLKNIASSAFELIKAVFTAAFDIIKSIVSTAFTVIKDVAINLFNALWEGIKSVFASIQTWFQNAWNSIVTWFSGLASGFYNAATTIFTSLWNGLKAIWTSVSAWVSEIFNGIVTSITGFATNLYNAGVSIFTSLWDGIKSVWESISSWVSEKVSWIAEKLAFWKSSNDEMSSGGSGITVDGSHANGLSYVPFDGYVALLHRGERVLTAAQNASYHGNTSNSTSNNTDNSVRINELNLNSPTNADFDSFMTGLCKKAQLIKKR